MKLFLASAAAQSMDKLVPFLPKPPSRLKLAFIPTAANPYQDRWFIDADRNKLKQLGFDINEIDIEGKRKKQLEKLFKGIDVIFVAGGNSFYLMEKSVESGFDQLVKRMASNGTVYIGSSAGSVLAGPNIGPVDTFDDPKDAPGLKSTKGLGLVDFVILPHYGEDKDKIAKYQKVIKKYKDKYKLIMLNNKQAVFVEDNSYKIIEAT